MSSNKPGIIRRLFSNIFLLLNIACVIWLLLCLLAAFADPSEIYYIAIFSMSTPFALVANIFFVLFWLFSTHKARVLFSLLTIAACYKITLTIFGLNFFGKNDLETRAGTIKVISWNVHGMGIFNRPTKSFEEDILAFLKKENADILCLPEYSVPKSSKVTPHAQKIIDNSNYVDYRFTKDNSLYDRIFLGTAVFSKYPFRNYESHYLSEFISMLQGDIELPDHKIIRVFFVHLTTFGLSDRDKTLIDDVKNRNTDIDRALDKSDFFISKFNFAFATRAKEVNRAIRIIKKSPHPVLLCGDFNDLPGSYTYTTMRGDLNDAFLVKGKGLGRSYNRILPTLRIDHVFYDPAGLRLKGFRCPPTNLSDHNPLITNFEILAKPQS